MNRVLSARLLPLRHGSVVFERETCRSGIVCIETNVLEAFTYAGTPAGSLPVKSPVLPSVSEGRRYLKGLSSFLVACFNVRSSQYKNLGQTSTKKST